MQVKEKSLPFIKAFRDDLIKHDRSAIQKNPDIPFLHFTGENGTHIVQFHPATDYPPAGERVPYLFGTADRCHILNQHVDIVKHLVEKPDFRQELILYSDGKSVKQIDGERALCLVDQYRIDIESAWNMKNAA